MKANGSCCFELIFCVPQNKVIQVWTNMKFVWTLSFMKLV